MGDRKEGTRQMGIFGYHSPQEKHERQKMIYTHSQQRDTKTQVSKFHENIAYLTAVK